MQEQRSEGESKPNLLLLEVLLGRCRPLLDGTSRMKGGGTVDGGGRGGPKRAELELSSRWVAAQVRWGRVPSRPASNDDARTQKEWMGP